MVRQTLLMASLLAVTGCGGGGNLSLSNLNPFNWGKSDVAEVQAERIAAARSTVATIDDGRILLPSVGSIALDRSPTGVILRASGVAPAVGYHSAGLRPVSAGRPDENGVARFELVALPPEAVIGDSSAFARQLNVATFLGNSRLRGVRQIVVMSAGDERSVRLR